MIDPRAEGPDRAVLRQVFERVLESVRGGEISSAQSLARAFGGADPEMQRRVEHIARSLGEGMTLGDAAGLERDQLDALYALGRSLFGAGDVERAHRVFQFLCMHRHLEGRHWLAFGIAQARMDRCEHALRSFTMGAMVTTDDPRFPLHAAEVHHRLGRVDEARSGAEFALALARGTEHEGTVARRARRLLTALSVERDAGERA